jgi:hypothetical protein
LDIFTLNHDLLPESLLAESSIPFADGFGAAEGHVRYFDPKVYESNCKVRLFKLHGSVNWFRFRKKEGDVFNDRYGIQVGGDSVFVRDEHGNLLNNLDVTPHFLTGINNKILAYGSGPVAEMHWWFHKQLKECTTIAMSGYGWNDKGINTRLMEWLHKPGNRRLVVMHESPETLTQSKSGMWHRYQPLADAGRIVPIRKWMQDTTLVELIRAVDVAT